MAILPKVKLKALPNFPTQVLGGSLISVTKTAGIFTISFDPSTIQQVDNVPPLELTQTFLFAWNPTSDVFSFVRYSNVASLGGGEKLVTATGDVTIVDNEPASTIGITNTSGAPISVFLPSALIRSKKITIVDKGINANTNNITVKVKLASGQTLMGGAQYIMDSAGASIGLTPWADGTGYY